MKPPYKAYKHPVTGDIWLIDVATGRTKRIIEGEAVTGWQERLKAERDDLKERLGRLNRFIMDDDNLKDISNKEVALLIAQTYAMTQLLDILDIRLTYVDKD